MFLIEKLKEIEKNHINQYIIMTYWNDITDNITDISRYGQKRIAAEKERDNNISEDIKISANIAQNY